MPNPLLRYAIIGTGRPNGTPGATGFGMAHTHLPAFLSTGRVELVAIADINQDPRDHFLELHKSEAPGYADYAEMLARERPDVVSICLWPHLHADAVVACAAAGVKAIHCEKPMATKWADCKRMKAAADDAGAYLTFGHQRRHIRMFQQVRKDIVGGAIGELVMIEAQVGDLFDWGTHWLDMMQWYNGEAEPEWVIGQIDSWKGRTIFGADVEDQALAHYKWKNGVRGLLVCGYEAGIGCAHRICGVDGVIEVVNERKYRLMNGSASGWQTHEVPQGELGDHQLSARDVIRQLDEPGHKSILSADNVIKHTELIFGTWYSSKARKRVDFPLEVDGNALEEMLADHEVGPDRDRSPLLG
ncbi:MAG: Gfo/Idh/MocA family oxidoreductase [Armatimonadetes bacterium]|nr:Gfo/Idh/MocA family oxidoreductase [Armatimonadota bacterium]MDE2205723.1 Gfo/Idh/MocA family oxidoreductase [Armatimonadota bacterium]